MIQRIQTLYLLFASACSALCAFFPLAYLTTRSGALYDLYTRGLTLIGGAVVQPTTYLFALVVAAAVVPFVTIFLYNKRMLQIRLCGFSFVLSLGIYILGGVYFYLSDRVFDVVSDAVVGYGVHWALFAPLSSMILLFLAGKAILQDELLIRSVNRIR